MRTRMTLMLAACGLALGPVAQAMPLGDGMAQTAQVGRATDRNAALEYWRLIHTASGHSEVIDRAKGAVNLQMHPRPDSGEVAVDSPATLEPGGALALELVELAGYLDDAERATRTPVCDFQIRYEDGYAMLISHLGPMRGIAFLMVADARRLALAGDEAGAAERLASTIRLSRHVVGDRTLINSLVSVAIMWIVIEESEWLLDRAGDPAAIRRVIGEALERFPLDDPYNVEGALRIEQDMAASLARQFHGPNAGRDFLAAMDFSFSGEDNTHANEVRAMDGAAFKRATERVVDVFDLVLEAWREDDPQAALHEIERACVEGQHGPLTSLIVPSLSNAQNRDAEARAKLRAFRDHVDGDG
ncbi:MAG: hypothetical protein NCW75_05025 [Phycisphaera sp.]|nr:MAG: hypothetical protein NCW75_05025 [Phycisphaera sp.]